MYAHKIALCVKLICYWFHFSLSIFSNIHTEFYTLTDPTLNCPGSLLKTTPPPQGYPWVSGGQHVTQEPTFRGLVLDHQLLEEPEAKNTQKEPNLIKNCSFWVIFYF